MTACKYTSCILVLYVAITNNHAYTGAMFKVKRYYTCNGTNEIRDGYTGASRLSVGWLVCRFKVSSQTTPTFPHFSKFSCIPISCDKANDNEREEENKANDNEREEENKAGITNEKKKTIRASSSFD